MDSKSKRALLGIAVGFVLLLLLPATIAAIIFLNVHVICGLELTPDIRFDTSVASILIGSLASIIGGLITQELTENTFRDGPDKLRS